MSHGAPATNKQLLEKYLELPQPDDGIMAEYIWIDGTGEGIRSKCRTLYKEPEKPSGKQTTHCTRVCVCVCACDAWCVCIHVCNVCVCACVVIVILVCMCVVNW